MLSIVQRGTSPTGHLQWLGLLGWSVLSRGGRLGRSGNGEVVGFDADSQRFAAALAQRPAGTGGWMLGGWPPGSRSATRRRPELEAGEVTSGNGDGERAGATPAPASGDGELAPRPSPVLSGVVLAGRGRVVVVGAAQQRTCFTDGSAAAAAGSGPLPHAPTDLPSLTPPVSEPEPRATTSAPAVFLAGVVTRRQRPMPVLPVPRGGAGQARAAADGSSGAEPTQVREPAASTGEPEVPSGEPTGRGEMLRRVLWWTGTALVSAGVLVALYLVYLLWFTGFQTDAAQGQMRRQWQAGGAGVAAATIGDLGVPWLSLGVEEAPAEAAVADAYAAIWFVRPETGERIVHADPLFVVEGVTQSALTRGPGHYPGTAAPGSEGNFAVSGHRTTYGAPFYDLQELRPGDEIHAVDRNGRRAVYTVQRSQVVSPDETWVLGDDPLGTGGGMMTLTTCHPRFSAAQRLIVFADLSSVGPTAGSGSGLPAEVVR